MKKLFLMGGLLILALSGCTDRKAERELLELKTLMKQQSEARLARIDQYTQAVEAQRRQAAAECQRREQEAARCSADQAAAAEAAQAEAAREEYARRFAPDGTLYLLRTVNVPIRDGLSSLLPGAEVALVRENLDGTIHVKQADGTLETDIPTAWTTDDRDLATDAQCADAAIQAAAAYDAGRMQTRASWHERRQQVRNGLAMDAAGEHFQRSQVQFGTNPLDGGSY